MFNFFFLLSLCMFMYIGLAAQKKQLSDEDINTLSVRITEPVLKVTKWDDKTVALSYTVRYEENNREVVVEISTGKIINDTCKFLKALSIKPPTSGVIGNILDATNPVPSPDSSYIAFTRHNDLYTIRVSDKKETRLTFDGSDVILNGYASWVYMEEILGRASNYRAFWWSPDGKRIVFFRSDDSHVQVFTVTDSPTQNGYVETWRYPKAGCAIPKVRAGVVSPDGGDIIWASIDSNETHYLGLPHWRPDSKTVCLQWLNRKQNKYKLLETDIVSGTTKELYGEQQNSWIALDNEPRIHFLSSGKGFLMQSDKSGWKHLYMYDMNGKLLRQLTTGNYTVLNVLGVDEKNKTVYFTCYKDNIGCEDFYKVDFGGQNLKRLSFGQYSHRISLSPDYKHFITTFSNVETPHKVALYTTQGKYVCEIQDSKTDNFDLYEQPKTIFIVQKSADGRFDVPMRITLPLNMEHEKKYPVKLSVYGGPLHLIVRNEWTDNFGGDVYRFSRDGLIQATIDHRGSGHNGKIGQEQMYRQLGYWELDDYKHSVKWLIENKQANPQKILISGFSYGGYITCYALVRSADIFTHGIAGGSVTDWALYDAIYTERYMDTPDNNPEGYKNSSVLEHAEKLQGKLLLTHGLRDENVHAQNTFQLVSILEEFGKSFELMIYPESRHGYHNKKNKYNNEISKAFIYKMMNEN